MTNPDKPLLPNFEEPESVNDLARIFLQADTEWPVGPEFNRNLNFQQLLREPPESLPEARYLDVSDYSESQYLYKLMAQVRKLFDMDGSHLKEGMEPAQIFPRPEEILDIGTMYKAIEKLASAEHTPRQELILLERPLGRAAFILQNLEIKLANICHRFQDKTGEDYNYFETTRDAVADMREGLDKIIQRAFGREPSNGMEL